VAAPDYILLLVMIWGVPPTSRLPATGGDGTKRTQLPNCPTGPTAPYPGLSLQYNLSPIWDLFVLFLKQGRPVDPLRGPRTPRAHSQDSPSTTKYRLPLGQPAPPPSHQRSTQRHAVTGITQSLPLSPSYLSPGPAGRQPSHQEATMMMIAPPPTRVLHTKIFGSVSDENGHEHQSINIDDPSIFAAD
jgi:hypothetical protein